MSENTDQMFADSEGLPAAIDKLGDTAMRLIDHLQGDRDDLAEILHDLVMLKAQDDIGCVPPPTAEQWAKAWRRANERFEP